MIKKLFKKKKLFTNETFLEELFRQEYNESTLLRMLESPNVDINYQDELKNSFLHSCLKNLKYKSAIWLIKNGIDIHLKDINNKTAFDIAIQKQNHEVVKLILSIETIEIDKRDQFGRTHLQDSVVLGDNEMARILIGAGADINLKDSNDRNVLFDALSYGNEKFIDELLDMKELDLNFLDINGDSIMHHPTVYNNDELAKKLISRGTDVTLQNKKGETYLCTTALRGIEAIDIVQTALRQGCDINSRVGHDNTILMELISSASKVREDELDRRESFLKMSRELVLNGIDVNALDENNETALFRAARVNDFDLVAFLLNSNVDPNIQNKQYETVLSIVAYKGVKSLDIFLLLLRHGADPTKKNKHGQSLFEILNNMVLHTHGKKDISDDFLLSKVDQTGQYMILVKEMLEHNKQDLDFLDSKGQPLFFTPLLYDHFALFKLYIKNGLNIHNRNIVKHNLFYAYVLKVFEDNNEKIDFQNNISMLLSAKIDHNYQDNTGWTVINKIIGTRCNKYLFETLTQVVLFDYKITDKLGRSVIHTAVWSDKRNAIIRIHEIDSSIINIADNYGILPITYAALLGNQELVLLFIDLGSNIKSGIEISKAAVKKFHLMVKNLEKLNSNLRDETEARKMRMVIEQVHKDFNIENELE